MFKVESVLTIGLGLTLVGVLAGCEANYDRDAKSDSSFEGVFFDNQQLHTEAIGILQANCAGCHGTEGQGGVSNITDVNHLVDVALITLGEPSQGSLIQAITEGRMPKGTTTTPGIPQKDLDVLISWIASMSYN